MCRAFLNKRFHTFPSLGNVFIIQLPEIHNVTPQLDNLSRWVVLPNKSIFALIPRIYAIPRQRLNQILAPSLKEKGKSLSLTKSPSTYLYFCVSNNSTKYSSV